MGPGRVKTLRGITVPGILRLVVTLRAKKCKTFCAAENKALPLPRLRRQEGFEAPDVKLV
jgi:hypothetical protein